MSAPDGDQVHRIIGQLQVSAAGHMQAAENLLAAVSDFTAGAEDLQPGDVIAWALAHAVAALAYELGAPRAFPAAAPGGPAVARPNPAPAAS